MYTLNTTGPAASLLLASIFPSAVLPILAIGTVLTAGIIAVNFARLIKNERAIRQ